MAAEQGATPSPAAGDGRQLTWPEPGWGCKPVLLEKTNCPGSETVVGSGSWDAAAWAELVPSAALAWGPASSVVLSWWPSGARSGPRSAFSNPTKCPGETRGPAVFPASEPRDALGHLSLANTGGIPCWSRLSNSEHWVGGFWHLHMWPRNALLSSAFWGDSALWLEHAAAETPTPASPAPASSLTLLPPTLASPGLSPQNWCAVCNLCFLRASDLVSHMWSCHKKEPAGPEPHAERREETLECPVCCEHFRERHHLS
ncbi:zinc finger protein 488 [Dasypus novemcinctus]|uniref:zinc finger protein 488 n=1 Tax=Dasypus novemcinctus TaxID=9361 RepID=UPI00062AAABD|nr:zinc finger protein 488 [Dasypus novemcinctus]